MRRNLLLLRHERAGTVRGYGMGEGGGMHGRGGGMHGGGRGVRRMGEMMGRWGSM